MMKKIFVVDFDNTLTVGEPTHLIPADHRDVAAWEPFLEASARLMPRTKTIDILLGTDAQIVILTARSLIRVPNIKAYLDQHGISHLISAIVGRHDDDMDTPTDQLKARYLKAWMSRGFEIVAVMDDHTGVLEQAAKLGLKTINPLD